MDDPAQTVTRVDLDVRYAETDQMGVVHHANYLVWFELARTTLCLEAGFPYADIERAGHLLMVVGADLRYLRPARYGDPVAIECRVDRNGARGLRFAYRVLVDGRTACEGTTSHVWVDAASRRPCRGPEHVTAAFRTRVTDAWPGAS